MILSSSRNLGSILSTKIPYQNSSLCLPGILLASQVELAVEGVVPGNLDRVALGVEVLELDLAALESLAEVSGHLNERGGILRLIPSSA